MYGVWYGVPGSVTGSGPSPSTFPASALGRPLGPTGQPSIWLASSIKPTASNNNLRVVSLGDGPGGQVQLRFNITSAGYLNVYRGNNTTLLATGTIPMTTNVWYFIAMKIVFSNTVGCGADQDQQRNRHQPHQRQTPAATPTSTRLYSSAGAGPVERLSTSTTGTSTTEPMLHRGTPSVHSRAPGVLLHAQR